MDRERDSKVVGIMAERLIIRRLKVQFSNRNGRDFN